MARLAKQLVGQWTGYDAPLLNDALEVVMARDPDLQLTPLSSGIHLAVLGPAAPDVSTMLATLPKTGAVISSVRSTTNTHHASHVSYELLRATPLGERGFAVQAKINNQPIDLSLSHLTRPTQAYAALAALALAHYRELDLPEIIRALADLAPGAGHGFIHEGINDSRIFDESSQAGPEDMRDTLDAFEAMPGERKIIITSDCAELLHHAGQIAQLVLLVGTHMHESANNAFLAGADVHCFDTAEEVSPWLTSFITPGDVILVKGRKEAGLEQIVDKLAF